MNEIGTTVRSCRKCDNVIKCPQPGYFKGDILFIFQNPAVPISGKWQDDILLDSNKEIAEVNDAYLSTLQNSKLGSFIQRLGLNWEDISITNVVKCPTPNNDRPSDLIVNNCFQYILNQIEEFKPRIVVLNGSLPKEKLYDILKDRYKVLVFYHYSYLFRSGTSFLHIATYKKQLNKEMR
jgi:hypothetical protein